MSARRPWRAARPLLLAWLAWACQRQPAPAEPPAADPPAPDRLGPGERLPESETAFGLALPPGMRLVRHFKDAAYFSGAVELRSALEHVAQHVSPREAQLVGSGAVFARVQVKGDGSGRQLRVTLTETARGSQIHIQDITPPPAAEGLSREERWRMAGRNPDGSLLAPSQQY